MPAKTGTSCRTSWHPPSSKCRRTKKSALAEPPMPETDLTVVSCGFTISTASGAAALMSSYPLSPKR